ncbi:MAG: outer membrane lipoprotein-sorting protein [Gillisia sp.]
MKNYYLFLFLLFFCSSFTQAQTAGEIVNSYLETSGGIKKLKDLKAIKMNAVIMAEDKEIPLEIYNTKNGKQALIIDLDGTRITQFAFDGKTMWTTDMLTGIAEKGLKEITANIKLSANDFPTPFLNYLEKGYTLEYIGEEKIGRSKTHKIKLIQEPISINGEQQESVLIYYFDEKTFLPVSKSSEIMIDGKYEEINQSYLSNYKEVKGLLFPFTIIESGQEIKIITIELDPEIDPVIFDFPGNSDN